MRLLNGFTCPDGHVHEHYVDRDVQQVPCGTCDLMATKTLVAPRVYLDPVSGDFPGATMKWAKMREKQIKWERKRNQ